MSRFFIVSLILHSALFVVVAFSSKTNFKPIKKFEVYKVSLAPMPQPKILKVEEEPEVPTEKIPEKIEEKVPPKIDGMAKKKEGVKKEEKDKPLEKKAGAKEGSKQGLPDIKPQIYTGSGRGFTYSYYLNILLNKIGQNWHNPFEGKDVVIKTIIYFEVDKTGRISNVRIEEDSGDEIYNESAIRAVALAKKLPPLPQEFSDDYLKVHLEFLTAQ